MANIFRTSSVWLKIAGISFVLGLILFVIGFATPAWSTYYGSNQTRGLWQAYVCSVLYCGTLTYSNVNDYTRAVQAMECIGLIGYALAFFTLLLYMVADSFRRRDFLQAAIIFTFGGILFAGIGFALVGARSNQENSIGYGADVGWSMGLAIAGTILYGVGGIMLILQLVR